MLLVERLPFDWTMGKHTTERENTMNKTHSVLLVLAMTVLLVGYGAWVYAADAAGTPPAKETKSAAGAAAAKPGAPAAKPVEEIKGEVKGTIECKTIKNKKGQEKQVCAVKVAEAKGADGKALDALKGKPLGVGGPKLAEVKKLAGKEVLVTGVIINGKRIRVESVKEAAAAPAPAAPAKK
jgi:hypothetical protein